MEFVQPHQLSFICRSAASEADQQQNEHAAYEDGQ